jgi:hypothetical protein
MAYVRVELTKGWFLGVAAWEGELLEITESSDIFSFGRDEREIYLRFVGHPVPVKPKESWDDEWL